MPDATRILMALDQGERQAAAELLPLVYDELRRLAVWHLANEKPGQTLQATALVHEAWLRLVGEQDPRWNGWDLATAGADNTARFWDGTARV